MSGAGNGTMTATGYNRPRLTGTLILNSDNGQQVSSGDPRNTVFLFNHDALFRGFGSLSNINDYLGFRISLNSIAMKNTGSAPVSTTTALQNVLLMTNNPPLVSGNSSGTARNIMMLARWSLSTTASANSVYYNTAASEYILPFSSDGQYQFQIILTTGTLSTDIMNFTGGYQPSSYSISIAMELIPKEIL